MRPVALTIAGSDPSGGAGLQADLKTFHQFGVYGEAVVTLLTVQNTVRVSEVEILNAELVGRQLDAVLEDIPPAAIKTGALGSAAAIEAVAARPLPGPLVVDPVMISKHGAPLMDEGARHALRNSLLPRAFLVTPNLHEASELVGIEVTTPEEMRQAARRIVRLGAEAVLIKGGHLTGDALDILYYNAEFIEFRSPRIDTVHTHGTGCTYSAAIAACLARGDGLPHAVTAAKAFITAAIGTSPGFGAGSGPVNHFASL
jgi:hydroxymethylpyrimidine/phosphomethylpyrimidine kinase